MEEEEPEEEMIPEVEYKQVQEELITEKMEKMTFESGRSECSALLCFPNISYILGEL